MKNIVSTHLKFRLKHRRLLLLFLCLVVPLTLSAGSLPARAQSATATEITILQPVDFTSFDPNTVSAQTTTNIAQNVLETLVARDETTPLLAESWKNLDNLTWQFQLRKGVKFTNGEPFNAEAVKFS